MNIISFANQILDLEADRNYWRREALHYKEMYEEWAQMANDSNRAVMESIGTVLLAAMDEDSGLNRMHRALERDPLKGARITTQNCV